MTRDDSRGALVVGVGGVIALSFGVSVLVTSTVTGEPGSMDRGFGQLYGSGFVVGSGAVLWWVQRQVRGFDSRLRHRVAPVIATTAVVSVLGFGLMTVSAVLQHDSRERALDATSTWRFDFASDLADAYRTWYHDQGGADPIYTGDEHEWWSLDPDGDGSPDADAPIMRTLRDHGWSERGLAIFDSDDDQIIDQIEWRVSSGSDETDAWCIPVSKQRSVFTAEWSNAEPRPCNGPEILSTKHAMNPVFRFGGDLDSIAPTIRNSYRRQAPRCRSRAPLEMLVIRSELLLCAAIRRPQRD